MISITYFDASALVKRYVAEEGSGDVARWLRDGLAATASLTAVEIASAIARRTREGAIAEADRDRILERLERDFEAIYAVELTTAVVARAERLLVRHPLRAGDAVQLASGLVLAEQLGRPVAFAAFDERLAAAARAEGLAAPAAGR